MFLTSSETTVYYYNMVKFKINQFIQIAQMFWNEIDSKLYPVVFLYEILNCFEGRCFWL